MTAADWRVLDGGPVAQHAPCGQELDLTGSTTLRPLDDHETDCPARH